MPHVNTSVVYKGDVRFLPAREHQLLTTHRKTTSQQLQSAGAQYVPFEPESTP